MADILDCQNVLLGTYKCVKIIFIKHCAFAPLRTAACSRQQHMP